MAVENYDDNPATECDLEAFYRPVALKAVAAALSIKSPETFVRRSPPEHEGLRWSPDFHGYPDHEPDI